MAKYNKKYKKKAQERLVILKKLKKKFFNTLAKNLHTKSEYELFFSLQFLNLVKKTLPSATNFLKMSRKDQRKIASTIDNYTLIESDWKALTSKINYETGLISKMFPVELKKFKKDFDKKYIPSENINNKNILQKYPYNKVKEFCKGFFVFIQDKKSPIFARFPFKSIDSNKLEIIITTIAKNFSSDNFFKDIVKVCMKTAYNNRIKVESSFNKYSIENLENPFLFVKRPHIMYSIQKSVLFYLCRALIEALKREVTSFDFEVNEKLALFLEDFLRKHEEDFLKRPEEEKTENNWFRDTYNITMFLILIFEECGVVIRKKKMKLSKEDEHETVIYWLKHDFENIIPFSHHLPKIIPPNKLTNKTNLKHIISPYRRGELSFKPSELALKSLNLAQSKKFIVNQVYLEFMNLIHNVDEFKLFDNKIQEKNCTNFPTVSVFKAKLYKYKQLDDKSLSINALQRYINKKATNFFAVNENNENKRTIYIKSLNVAGVSQVESNLNYQKTLIWQSFSIAKSKRQLLQTSLVIAEMFNGFPIYYGTKLDFRARMYPWEYLMSRTTGELKQLLCDFDSQPLTDEGLVSLMTAYYQFSLTYSFEWHKFLRSDLMSKVQLWTSIKEFFTNHNFHKNPEMFDCDGMAAFILTLHANIEFAFDDKKSSIDVVLEIDQVASGVTILSILLGVEKLAKKSNVLGGKPRDIYRYLMNRTETFFNTQILRILEFNRKKQELEDKENKTKLDRDASEEGTEKYKELDAALKKVTAKKKKLEASGVDFSCGEKLKLTTKDRKEFDGLISFLSTNRSCVKSTLMTWSYSQKRRNRRRSMVDALKEHRSTGSVTNFEYKVMETFATHYDRFLETLFPKIALQKKFFEEVLDVRIKAEFKDKNIHGMNINTLDGSKISWGLDPFDTISKNVWDPIANKNFNVSIKVKGTVGDSQNTLKSDKKKRKRLISEYHRGLFPNLIHSIEGSLMRLIIYRVWKKSGYVIAHLHDCILCHPNAVCIVYEVLSELYTDETLKNLADDVFFTPMQEGLSEDEKKVIKSLREEFYNNRDDFEINLDNFVAENAYTFEGSVKRDVLYENMTNKGLAGPVQLINYNLLTKYSR